MQRVNFSLYFGLVITCVLATLVGCSTHERTLRMQTTRLPAGDGSEGAAEKEAPRQPWEIWPYGRTLDGARIGNIALVRGDDALAHGKRAEALVQYREALKARLSRNENEATIYRIAASELSLDTPEKTLTTLSAYFRTQGIGVAQVPPHFALLFGYAYGRKNDVDQALAWFSRVGEISRTEPGLAQTALTAVRRLVSSVSNEKLDAISGQWKNEMQIATMIGEERARRSDPARVSDTSVEKPFADLFAVAAPALGDAPAVAVVSGEGPKIGLLLPLSGQFANLGTAIKNGAEIALAGANSEAPAAASFVARDTTGSAAEALMQAQQLFTAEGARALIGPLLADEAVAVSDVVRAQQIPMIAFSKKSDFQTGECVFRLAPTAEAQINSLFNAATALGLSRFALVYPDDAAGTEFSRIFRRKLEEKGLKAAYDTSYPKDQLDPLIERAKELEHLRVDGVFFPDSIAHAAHFFSSLGETARRKMRPLGLANWDSSQDMLHSAGALDGALFVSPFFRESVRPVVVQFSTIYKQRYGSAPDFLAAQGFDAATMLLAALRREQKENVPLLSALKGIDTYDGITGRIHLDPRGEFQHTFAVVELREGKINEVSLESAQPQPSF